MSEFESSSPTNLVVAVLRPARTASLNELWKSSLGNMAARFTSPCAGHRAFRVFVRVGRPSSQLHQTCAPPGCSAEVPHVRFVASVAQKRPITLIQHVSGRAQATALNSRRCEGWLCSLIILCFKHDANDCPWELYRWRSNGLTLCYDLLRREP